MVTKALKIALCVALSGTAVFASESGKLAARAQKSFKAGNFSKGYSQLDRALVASPEVQVVACALRKCFSIEIVSP